MAKDTPTASHAEDEVDEEEASAQKKLETGGSMLGARGSSGSRRRRHGDEPASGSSRHASEVSANGWTASIRPRPRPTTFRAPNRAE